MRWAERRARFRAILAGGRCIHPASVFDPVSARIAGELGFEAMMLAGSVASHAVLGAPDLIVLTLTELADQAYRINRAGTLPLIVDADHGFGNALNVKRTVEELETAGVAALSIEDTDLPEPFGSGGKPRLIPVEEGVGKMKAALAGRQDPALCVLGRTGAMAIAGRDEAVARARAYEAAGVDAMFLSGVTARDELDAVAASVTIPLILGNAPAALADPDYLASRGVRACLQGHAPFAAAVQASYETLKALRDGTKPAELSGVASPDTLKRLTGGADYARWRKGFLGG